MSPQTSLAILGAGIFAKEAHIPALKTLGDSVSIKAVYSRSEKSATDLAKEVDSLLGSTPQVYHDADPVNSLDALLARSDIDAVIVVLPINTQPGVILKALAAGKHVISEKPVAKDVKTGLELLKAYNSDYKPKGLIWKVAENTESDSGVQAIGKAVREGKIGKVASFAISVENSISQDSKWYKTPWRTVPDYQGGFLLDGGVHTAAALRAMLPEPLKYLAGFASLNIEWLAPHDTITTTIQTTNGIHGTFSITFALPAKSIGGQSFKITGSKGQLITSSEDGKLKVTITNTEGHIDSTLYPVDGVPIELANFIKVVKGGDDNGLGDPYNTLKDVALIQAALTSNGERVDLEELAKQL